MLQPDKPVFALLSDYQTILLDAYGVLINQAGRIDGADRFIERLNQSGQPYYILTNDASRLPTTIASRFQELGLAIDASRIISSGSLLLDLFASEGLQEARCLVLGTKESRAYVERAGGTPLEPRSSDIDADVVVICDDSGFAFQPGIEAAMTMLFRRIDAGQTTRLILCNPDLIYPKGGDAYGLTSGSVALLLEAALNTRYGKQSLRLHPWFRLGKPYAPIFAAALARSGTQDMLLVGDQLPTDVKGALDFGIDCALITTGLTGWRDDGVFDPAPTHVCSRLI